MATESEIRVRDSSPNPTVPLRAFDLHAPLRITADDLAALEPRTDEETARKVWREARARLLARADPLILGTYVIRTAYRMIREWARTIGVLGYDSALSSLTIDKLLIAQPCGDPPLGPFCIRAYAQERKIIEDRTIPKSKPQGLPLMPSEHADFTPKHQRALAAAMREISMFLRLDQTEYGAVALEYLIQTPPNPRNWPEPSILYAYEGALVDEVLGVILERGTRNAETHLQSLEGGEYLPHEARGLARLAKLESRSRMEAEIEEDRSILAMRLEDLIQRSRSSFDGRLELGAIKQLAIVQGVTRAEPEDALSDFARVVRKVSNESPPPPPMIEQEPPSCP